MGRHKPKTPIDAAARRFQHACEAATQLPWQWTMSTGLGVYLGVDTPNRVAYICAREPRVVDVRWVEESRLWVIEGRIYSAKGTSVERVEVLSDPAWVVNPEEAPSFEDSLPVWEIKRIAVEVIDAMKKASA